MRTIETQVFTLDELEETARNNAYSEWLESVLYYDIEDQLSCGVDYDARAALATVGINYDCDSYGRVWPVMRGMSIPQTGHAERMADVGEYCSIDMAEAFNAHGPALEEYAAMWYQVAFPEYGTPFYECDDQTGYDLMGMFEELYLQEFEAAAQDALNKWTENRECEREYMTSFEAFADEFNQGYSCRTTDGVRVYYHDSRKWYTADGEYYGDSNVSGACISIVKTS